MYTELELVNHILHTLGQDVTATLETQHPAVVGARQTLLSYNKEFQGRGWWFNQEQNVKLVPDVEGKIAIPEGTLTFAVARCILESRSAVNRARFVKRGNYLYDNVEHTGNFTFPVWVDYTVLIDYEDLPQEAAAYLKHYAADAAFIDDDGDAQQWRILHQRTMEAEMTLKRLQLKNMKHNALLSPSSQNLLAGVLGAYSSSRNPRLIGG